MHEPQILDMLLDWGVQVGGRHSVEGGGVHERRQYILMRTMYIVVCDARVGDFARI